MIVSEKNVKDLKLTIYPTDGYGNPEILRQLIRF